jgi:hypothetical protein
LRRFKKRTQQAESSANTRDDVKDYDASHLGGGDDSDAEDPSDIYEVEYSGDAGADSNADEVEYFANADAEDPSDIYEAEYSGDDDNDHVVYEAESPDDDWVDPKGSDDGEQNAFSPCDDANDDGQQNAFSPCDDANDDDDGGDAFDIGNTVDKDGGRNDDETNTSTFNNTLFNVGVVGIINMVNTTERFVDHAKATYGGGKSPEAIKSLLYRVANFLCWSYHDLHHCYLNVGQWTSWVTALLETQYPVLAKYSASLELDVLLMPSTILTYLSDLKYFMRWYSVFRTVGIQVASSFNFDAMACAVAKGYNKLRKNNTLRHRSLETAVKERKLPAGGLVELQQIVRECAVPAIASVAQELTPKSYRHFMELVLAAIYVFSAQGRFSAVSMLKYSQALEMLENGQTMSTEFKTNKTFGYQPVTLHSFSKQLLTIYVEELRPKVALAQPTPDAFLWLNHNGVPMLRSGVRHSVTRFFRRSPLQFGVTTTAIRTLVETKVEKMYRMGELSYDQRVAVSNISGHNSATVRMHYLMQDRLEDTKLAGDVFDVIMKDSQPADDQTPYLDFSTIHDPCDVGTATAGAAASVEMGSCAVPAAGIDNLSPPCKNFFLLSPIG